MKAKFLLLFISTAACLCLAEICLRATGKYDTYTERTHTGGYVSPYDVGYVKTWYRVHEPNTTIAYANKEFTQSWLTNNEGLNDKVFSPVKSGKRIMVLGDSFTEGSGAPNDSSYPRQLAVILHDSLSIPLEVWNCGVGGSDPFFEYVLLRDRLLRYGPDMLVVTINNTDVGETIIRGGFERFDKDGHTHYKTGPWFEPLFSHSTIIRAIILDICHYNWLLIKQSDEEKLNARAIRQLYSAMDSFAVLCTVKKIKLLFIFHPMLNELDGKITYFALPHMYHCRQMGYDYVDAKAEFYKMGIDSAIAPSLYWPDDGHFNKEGYHYLALSIWHKIVALL